MQQKGLRRLCGIGAILSLGSVLGLSLSAFSEVQTRPDGPFLVVLGVGQDGGFPQAGTPPGELWNDRSRHRMVTSLGLVDPIRHQRWMFDATPDFTRQLHDFDRVAPPKGRPGLDGIFLTHGHVGHYTGLMFLGREVLGADRIPVYSMPRMGKFLMSNGPWDQLVRLENIEIRPLENGLSVDLEGGIRVTPLLVPHRDEYTETVGFWIQGPKRSALFIPDIDKWERWDSQGTKIEDWIAKVDVAYLDGSFFKDGEIPGRAMEEIPHPFIRESLARFAKLPEGERAKIRFIHLNRTNPALDPKSPEGKTVIEAGSGLAFEGEIFPL